MQEDANAPNLSSLCANGEIWQMTEQLPKDFSNSHCEKCETGTQYTRDVWPLSVCAPVMHLSQSEVGVHLFSTVGCRRGVKS